jgi:hypothetical protein
MIGDAHYGPSGAAVIGRPLHGGHAEAPGRIVMVTVRDVA